MEEDYLISLLHSGLDLDSDFVLKTLALQPRAVLARLLEEPRFTRRLLKIFNQDKFWEIRLDSEEMREDLAAYATTLPRAPPISLQWVGKLFELSTLTGRDLFQAACALTEYHEPSQLQAIAQAVQFLTLDLNKERLQLRASYGQAILKCLRLNPLLLAQLLRYGLEVVTEVVTEGKGFKWFVNLLALYPREAQVMLKSLLGPQDYNVHYTYTHLLWKHLQNSKMPVYQLLRKVVEEEIIGVYYRLPIQTPQYLDNLFQPVDETASDENLNYNYAEKERFGLMPVGWAFEYYITISEMGGIKFLNTKTKQFSYSVLLAVREWIVWQRDMLSFGVLDTLYSWNIDIFDESTWPASLLEARKDWEPELESLGLESLRGLLEEADDAPQYDFYLRLLMHEEKKWGPAIEESPVFQVFLGAYEVLEEDTRALVDLLRAK